MLRIYSIHFNNMVRKKLDEQGIDYASSYDDLTDEQYWEIRRTIITQSKTLGKKFDVDVPSENEQRMIAYVEAVLTPAYDDDLRPSHKLLFTLLWLVAFATPILQWMFYKGHLDKLLN
jgi:hypothetical protein